MCSRRTEANGSRNNLRIKKQLRRERPCSGYFRHPPQKLYQILFQEHTVRFELNEYKRELTDEEILQDIKSVASSLGTDYISISLYKEHGKYSQCAIQRHFGTWKNALAIAGLRTERTPDERCRVSNEDLFEDLRRVAKELQSDTVSYDAYKKHGKYSDEVFFSISRRSSLRETS